MASYRTVRYVLPLCRVMDGDERSVRGNRRNRLDGKKATKDPVGTSTGLCDNRHVLLNISAKRVQL